MKTTFKIIKRNYGVEFNNLNTKEYTTKEAAINAGNSWLKNCTVHAEIRKGWNFEVIEVNQNNFKFTGIARTN
jgi:hypothetical protein